MTDINASASTGLVWLVGVVLVVLTLEFVPRIGGAILLLLVVYLAYAAHSKGAI